MRRLADIQRIREFMRALGAEAEKEGRLYFTGGVTAVLFGWRETTIDADILIVPESDRLFRALPRLKEALEMNIELASPADFIPELPGWQERSLFIAQEGRLAFHHYDLYSQALAKIERRHSQDLEDVRQILRLIDPHKLMGFFEAIEGKLYRYPAIDPPSFRRSVTEIVGRAEGRGE